MFTALLIAILIVAGAATVVGGGLVLAAQRRRALEGGGGAEELEAGDPKVLERGLGDLRVGDVIQTGGRDYLVEGVIHYDEDGHRWVAGRLVDAEDVQWLVVGMERAGTGDAQLVQPDEEVEVSGYPPETILSGGKRYNLDKRGTATAKVVGDAGQLGGDKEHAPESVNRCRWWRYEGAGADCLIVEQWGADFRALRGQTVSSSDLEMIPGS